MTEIPCLRCLSYSFASVLLRGPSGHRGALGRWGYADTYGAYVQAKKVSLKAVTTWPRPAWATVMGASCRSRSDGLASLPLGVLPSPAPAIPSPSPTPGTGHSAAGTITVLPYAAPGIRSISVTRCDADEQTILAGAYALAFLRCGRGPPSGDRIRRWRMLDLATGPLGIGYWSSLVVVPAASGQYAPRRLRRYPGSSGYGVRGMWPSRTLAGRTDSLIVILPSAQVLFRTAPRGWAIHRPVSHGVRRSGSWAD